jgi:hypothetical protein
MLIAMRSSELPKLQDSKDGSENLCNGQKSINRLQLIRNSVIYQRSNGVWDKFS